MVIRIGQWCRDGYFWRVASIQHTTDLQNVCPYKISARSDPGNWSQISSGYLVVYNPTSGVKAMRYENRDAHAGLRQQSDRTVAD